jgi:hypothetical protein
VGVSFPDGGFAPTRVEVTVHGGTAVRLAPGRRRDQIAVRARAVAEIAPDPGADLGMPAYASGGGYDGPLAYRMGKPRSHLFPG